VGNCCRARSCEQFFKPSVARRSLETYRTKGLDKLERQMIAIVSAAALDGARVLEIGGASVGSRQSSWRVPIGEVVELVER
jgi:hypothetical protein